VVLLGMVSICPGGGLALGHFMMPRTADRGLTLVETLLAASLLFTMAAGIAGVLVLTRQLAIRANQMTVATLAASARLERLRAVPWSYDLDGSTPDVAALDITPPDTLERNVAGYHEWLDAAGRSAQGGSDEPAMVVRWAIVPGADRESRGFEVCVFGWPATPGASPLLCLASARGRQP